MRADGSRGSWLVGTLQRFLRTEAAGAIVLLAASAVAMIWANLAGDGYRAFWETDLSADFGGRALSHDLRHWINDGAMALFFFIVGLEVKRELLTGELRDPRAAALPVFAAVGGMVVPAGIYLAINAGRDGVEGWAIPMATDIAFAVGVLALVGRRLPPGLKLFLLTLAIVDDIGSILVIAIAYSTDVSLATLGVAALALAGLALAQRVAPRLVPLQLVAALAVWAAVSGSGIHATIAGIAVALVTPVRSAARLEHAIHPWTSFLIVPAFALANAGVVLGDLAFEGAGAVRVGAGIAAGLVLGKIVGISAGAALSTRVGLARLPDGATWTHVIGISAIAGIGFTVSLFVAGLAFEGALLDAAKIGVLGGSVLAGGVGAAVLLRAAPSGR